MNEEDREAPADEAPLPPTDATPAVAWGAPPPAAPPVPGVDQFDGGPPPFTVGALLSDTFARYGADPIRLFLISLGPAVLSYLFTFLAPATALNPSAIGVSLLLSILGLVVTVVGTAVLYALADGGRSISFIGALRRGVARSGWVFLTLLTLGLGGLLALLVIAIPAVLLIATRSLAPLAALVFLVGFLILGWALLRLSLAIPGVVVDNLNTSQALSLSWKITRRAGIWLRILATLIVVGLLISPAGILAGLLVFTDLLPAPVLLLLASVLVAFVTPVSGLVTYSAYRRLVPPAAGLEPAAALAVPVAPAPVDAMPTSTPTAAPEALVAPPVPWAPPVAAAPPAPAASARPRFVAPRLGTAGKAIIVLLIVLGVGGIASVPFVVGRFLAGGLNLPGGAGFPGFPNASGLPGFPSTGNVARGTVAFGTSSSLATCTVVGQTNFVPEGSELVWMASLTRRTTFSDQVRLRITVDGTEVGDDPQDPGIFDCLGTEQPEIDIAPGIYVFEVLVNGRVDATGTLFVG